MKCKVNVNRPYNDDESKTAKIILVLYSAPGNGNNTNPIISTVQYGTKIILLCNRILQPRGKQYVNLDWTEILYFNSLLSEI